ncbi:MAG: GNAT family N-acetyltransferase [Clostridia bacterium]|nr:GNAT family N-acetyltransferase [Clostridia bacterium]
MTHSIKTSPIPPNMLHYQALSETGAHMSSGVLSFRTLHFAGKEIPCGGIGGINTDPEYRRSGLVREIIGEMAAECDRREIPLTVLHPFSFAYYRSFGFERVADHKVLEFPITALNFVPRYPDLVRCVGDTHKAELAQVYNTFAADGRHLMFGRDPDHFPTRDEKKKVYLSYDQEGRPDGYLILEIENYFSVNRMVSVNLHVHELISLTDEAMDKLFGFIRMYEGEMETVKMENISMIPEVELRLRHYMHTSITIFPDIMVRINDIRGFFEAIPYPAEAGCFTFKTSEPPRSPWSGERINGVWRVTYAKGQATVEKLPDDTEDYDFYADIASLAQLVFGYDSYGYDTARHTHGTRWRTPAPDFFSAFPRRPAGIFEHF